MRVKRKLFSSVGLHKISLVFCPETEKNVTDRFARCFEGYEGQLFPGQTHRSASRPARFRPAPLPHCALPLPNPPKVCLGLDSTSCCLIRQVSLAGPLVHSFTNICQQYGNWLSTGICFSWAGMQNIFFAWLSKMNGQGTCILGPWREPRFDHFPTMAACFKCVKYSRTCLA